MEERFGKLGGVLPDVISLVQGKVGEKRALDKARSLHSRVRSIVMVR